MIAQYYTGRFRCEKVPRCGVWAKSRAEAIRLLLEKYSAFQEAEKLNDEEEYDPSWELIVERKR